jgi:hypothetical protein
MKKYILGTLGVAAVLLFVNSAIASTGNFTSPLTSAFLSVDLNGGNIANQNATTEGWGTSGPLGPDNFGVQWSPWGGPTGTGGDGTQLPSSQSSPTVTATSISKTFGSVTATLSIDEVNSSYYSGNTLNSRDRGAPSGTANDADMFRDLVFAGSSGAIQGQNYLQLTLSGLTAGAQYEIATYSFDTTGSHSMNWTATAPTEENNKDGWWDGTADGTFTAPADEQTITWTGGGATQAPAIFTVTANGLGDISVYGFGGNGVTGNQNADTSYLNGFQIETVPEPATAALFGFGSLLSMLFIRRRK